MIGIVWIAHTLWTIKKWQYVYVITLENLDRFLKFLRLSKNKFLKHVIYENMVTTADYWPALWWSPPLHHLFVQEQDAEKKVMNRTARAWYKSYAYSAKLDRIVDHNEGPKNTGAKRYVCPGTAKSTGAIFPLPLWVRRLWFHSFTTLLLKKFCHNWVLLFLFANFRLCAQKMTGMMRY